MKIPSGYHGHARDLVKETMASGTKLVPRTGVDIVPNVKVYPRMDGNFVIFDKRLPLGTDAGVFGRDDDAVREARRIYATEVKPGSTKQSASDEELFAAMKRAMANGFRCHEPAEDA